MFRGTDRINEQVNYRNVSLPSLEDNKLLLLVWYPTQSIFFTYHLLLSMNINLPITCTMLDLLSFPATLCAVHVYWPSSCSSASLIVNEPSSLTLYLPTLEISWPSFVHVTVGNGTPLIGQWIVMLVLVSAVRLSPMVMLIGALSLASIIFGWPEGFTEGFEGSVDDEATGKEQ